MSHALPQTHTDRRARTHKHSKEAYKNTRTHKLSEARTQTLASGRRPRATFKFTSLVLSRALLSYKIMIIIMIIISLFGSLAGESRGSRYKAAGRRA